MNALPDIPSISSFFVKIYIIIIPITNPIDIAITALVSTFLFDSPTFLFAILYPTAKNIKVKGKNIKMNFYIFSVRICLQQILSES